MDREGNGGGGAEAEAEHGDHSIGAKGDILEFDEFSGVGKRTCNRCGQVCTSQKRMYGHFKDKHNKHGQYQYICLLEGCRRRFISKPFLRQHRRVHRAFLGMDEEEEIEENEAHEEHQENEPPIREDRRRLRR